MILTTFKRFGAVLLLAAGAATPAAAQIRSTTVLPPPGSPFLGGVPDPTASPHAITISLGDAIRRALDHNLGVLQAGEGIERARGTRWEALSDLLPHVDAGVTESRRKTNLEAFGFPLRGEIPRIVGPFNVFDARVFLSQAVVDISAIKGNRAEEHNVDAARFDYRSARDLVVIVSANLYLQALAAAARVDTVRAQLETSDALYTQAQNLQKSGIVAGLDVIRAEVRLSADRQRATAATNDLQKSRLQLARVMGLPIGQEFTLSSQVPDNVPYPSITLEAALENAYRERPDYLAAQARVKAAASALDAVRSERLPALHLNADYGTIGLDPGSALPTFNITAALTVPVFEGGRTHGRAIRAEAELNQRRAEADDMRAEVYYGVRGSFLDLQATSEALESATRGRDLAAQQLAQSRDRFAAGVANNVEVIQAQEAVMLANERYIEALYGFGVAKAMLARSVGGTEETVLKLLGAN